MLFDFGLDPARVFALTARQFNALCDFTARESRRRREWETAADVQRA